MPSCAGAGRSDGVASTLAAVDADQYRDSSNLDARISLHARFGTNPVRWHQWVASRIGGLAGRERILEVGCGTGELWHESGTNPAATHTVVLTDLSDGMVRRARERLGTAFCFAVADAAALPVARVSMDLVLANHMLYHVPDRVAAIGELRRVLRESGVLCAATNGPGHLAELDDLVMEAGGGGRQAFWRQGFSLENGQAQLAGSFSTVELHLYDDSLAVTDPDAILAHLGSYMELTRATADRIRTTVEDEITRSGSFHVRKNFGLFVARP